MKTTILLLLLVSTIYASESCMEKLHRLDELKTQKLSIAERIGLGLLAGDVTFGYFIDKYRDKRDNLEEKIRVLELELIHCEENGY